MTPLDVLIDQLAQHRYALALGGGQSVVAAALSDRGLRIDSVSGDWPSVQLPVRYPLVIIESSEPDHLVAAIVHCAVQHVAPGGDVVVMGAAYGGASERFDLKELSRVGIEGSEIIRLRRTDRTTIHDTVFAARSRIARTTPPELAERLASDNAPVVVDTRTVTDRGRFGVIAGSIHVPRTVVEWHLDPANGYRHPAVTSFGQPLVLVCNGGYSSSLAAANLLDLGFTDVGDLIGGIRAWIESGQDLVEPDHSHLDL